MDGFIIRLAPLTSSQPKDKQTVIERQYLEVTANIPMSPGSSPALNANIRNASTVTRTGHTEYFGERGFWLIETARELFMDGSSKKLVPASIKRGDQMLEEPQFIIFIFINSIQKATFGDKDRI
ncbi:unnamed protein product [Clonostachys rosea f. rosea IK726]|uniref:Uncharacterized protein n=1 Tax=Clonostachys rosea f. rosea IK726 TaxID=1349383 RepID=A0ACA9URA9_BIOOC|nr:unnamed protein product [Clonostachys rosea f. rosea IK726]